MLLVISTSAVMAFGKSSEKEKTEKNYCSKQDNHSEKKTCCNNREKDNDNCGGACDYSSCHYPSTINIPTSFNDFELSYTNNYRFLNNDWAYVQHIPKAIYLSIWLPPKIS